MEEAQEILLSSLEQFGVSLPAGVSSIREMAPSALISICSQSLSLIDSSVSFPTSLPDSTAERIDICTKITSSIKALGYRGDLSFHQFLYLSSVDAYNLVRFLVERLSRSSRSIKLDGERAVISRYRNKKNESCSDVVKDPLRGWTKGTDMHEVDQTGQTVPVSSVICHINTSPGIDPLAMEFDDLRLSNIGSSEALATPVKKDLLPDGCPVQPTDGLSSGEQLEQRILQSCKQGYMLSAEGRIQQKEKLLEEFEETKVQEPIRRILENQKDDIFVCQNEKPISLPETSLMLQGKDSNQGIGIGGHFSKTEKSTMEMTFGDQSHAESMGKKPGMKEDSLLELQLEWDAFRLTVEETRKSLILSGQSEKPEVQEKLGQLDEIGKEIVDMICRVIKSVFCFLWLSGSSSLSDDFYRLQVNCIDDNCTEEVCSKFPMELEKQPKMAPRSYYIQRITELSKNSWKQDADIKQIMKDTWQLQLEINSIQERLGRTYTVVDDTVFRDAKKDPVRKQAYRLLVSIHESFSQIADTILAIDRVKREASDYEAKLASLSSGYFGIDKLEADLNSLQRENELLEKQRL